MKMVMTIALAVALGLSAAACHKADAEMEPGARDHGRYQGVGIYEATRMWAQRADVPKQKDSAAATLDDDSYVIAVVDTKTGEVRECGEASGICFRMEPWAAPAGALPARVGEHAAQLRSDDDAKEKAAEAVPLKRAHG